MEEELVTVVVPIYKVEKYLERCIVSIVDQTYKNLEIILVDDGSPDLCPEICESWAKRDSRICVVHKENAGLGMARNTGIEAASGRYICFIDSDDYIALNTIKAAHEAAHRYGADLVVFGMKRVNNCGIVAEERIPVASNVCYSGKDVQDIFLPDWIDNRYRAVQNKNLCLSAWSCLFSMELIQKTKWKFVSERELISEDSFSLISLAQHVQSVAILEEALYFYCENEDSLSRTYRPDRYEKIRKFHYNCISMAQKNGYSEKVLRAISGLTFAFVVAAMKQIAALGSSRIQKKQAIISIIEDNMMIEILRTVQNRYDGMARKLLIFVMKKKWITATLLLLDLQVRKDQR